MLLFKAWTGYSDKKRDDAFKQLLEIWGSIAPNQYTTYQVPISTAAGDTIHVLQINTQGKQPLVLIHGFGGSGIVFYKYFQRLSEHYTIYAIDLRGAGLSGRGYLCDSSLDSIENYFIEGVHKFIATKLTEKPIIIGHSLGGYVATLYAHRHPENCHKLFLLSPAGYSKLSKEKFDKFITAFSKFSFGRKFALYFASPFINGKMSPFHLLRYIGKLLSKKLMKRYGNYIAIPNKEECGDYLKFLYHMNLQNPCSDTYIGKLLTLEGCGHEGLEDRVELKVPTHFIYGKDDWMNCEGAIRTQQKNKSLIHLSYIEDAGHNLNLQGVNDVLKIIDSDNKIE